MVKRRFVVRESPPEDFFSSFPELPKVVAHLLYHRNLKTQSEIDEFLKPDYSVHVHDPFLFKDMEKAAGRVLEAIKKNEKIVIHGDYDADGVSASVILHSVLTALQHQNLEAFLPHRELDGYGLAEHNIKKIADSGAKLLISCDCGISNTPEITLAENLGLNVIITDHHTVPEQLPPAYAIIHPKIPSETYPDKTLSGGGVAFKLAQAVVRTWQKENGKNILPNGEDGEAFLKWQLDMVAISSVADMVPLLGESRTLTKYGLIVLNKTRRPGLSELIKNAGALSKEDGSKRRKLSGESIAFHIAPRINAAGRMAHALLAFRLLAAKDKEEAENWRKEIEGHNSDRQKLTEELVKQALILSEKQSDRPIISIMGEGWPASMVGLIASRLKDRFHKPIFCLTKANDKITGSGRSTNHFNMAKALQKSAELFVKFGGHPGACGFTLRKETTVEDFRREMEKNYHEETADLDTTPTLEIDAEIDFKDITWELYDLVSSFNPFGMKNEPPTYLVKGVRVVLAEMVGDGRHLRLICEKNGQQKKIMAFGFGRAEKKSQTENQLVSGAIIDAVFTIDANEWNGNREIQLTLVDCVASTENLLNK